MKHSICYNIVFDNFDLSNFYQRLDIRVTSFYLALASHVMFIKE